MPQDAAATGSRIDPGPSEKLPVPGPTWKGGRARKRP